MAAIPGQRFFAALRAFLALAARGSLVKSA
jgi:hypothetical protein